MNSGIGLLMTVIIAIMIAMNAGKFNAAIDAESANELFAMVKKFAPIIVTAICLFPGSMNMISAPSISLEDKNLWILQVAPIDPRDILRAKLLCHCILGVPFSIIGAVIICVSYNIGIVQTILCSVCSAAMIVAMGYWGLFLGLTHPKFDWQNENLAVKQGFAVNCTMFGGMLLALILSVLGIGAAFVSEYLSFVAILLPLVAISIVLHRYLMTKGAVVFSNLKKN